MVGRIQCQARNQPAPALCSLQALPASSLSLILTGRPGAPKRCARASSTAPWCFVSRVLLRRWSVCPVKSGARRKGACARFVCEPSPHPSRSWPPKVFFGGTLAWRGRVRVQKINRRENRRSALRRIVSRLRALQSRSPAAAAAALLTAARARPSHAKKKTAYTHARTRRSRCAHKHTNLDKDGRVIDARACLQIP